MGKRRRRTYLQAGGGAEGCQREGGMGEERGFLGWKGGWRCRMGRVGGVLYKGEGGEWGRRIEGEGGEKEEEI